MIIPPFLERLLLSNEAEFKNASLGLSGQNMVFVPQGKTAVILEVSIEPFSNTINPTFLNLLTGGFLPDTGRESYISAVRRIVFQLQIINDKYNSHINFCNEFELVNNLNFVLIDEVRSEQTININFRGKREELFIYIDRSLYFNLLFPYKYNDIGLPDTGITPDYTTPNNGFIAKIQNLPNSPITFNNNIAQDYLVNAQVNSPALDHYYSVNHQTNPTYGNELPQMEYLKFFAGANETSIQQPLPTGTVLQWHDLMTLPLINVKYALLNKRAADYGITTPGK